MMFKVEVPLPDSPSAEATCYIDRDFRMIDWMAFIGGEVIAEGRFRTEHEYFPHVMRDVQKTVRATWAAQWLGPVPAAEDVGQTSIFG